MKISKRLIFLLTLWMLVLITGIATSLMVAQASRNSTINLIHQASYNAPANIPVTVSANGGTFDENDPTDDTYNTYITIGNLTTSSTVLPVNTPIRSGYVFDGWEYSTDGTTYSDYSPSSNMPFTDHLYIRAKWSQPAYTVSLIFSHTDEGSFISGTSDYSCIYYQLANADSAGPLSISSTPSNDINSGNWIQCDSASVVISNVQRIYITLGGSSTANVDCIIYDSSVGGTEIFDGHTGSDVRTGSYYFDSGVLNGDISYYFNSMALHNGGGGGI